MLLPTPKHKELKIKPIIDENKLLNQIEEELHDLEISIKKAKKGELNYDDHQKLAMRLEKALRQIEEANQ